QDAIKAANNMEGIALVAGQTLRIPDGQPVMFPPAGGNLLADVRPLAERYLGVPYRYGGTTPSGLDCSGFTSVVLLELGVKVPRTAEAQYAAGTPVTRDNLRAGDLVFFDTLGSGVSHVGIYLADGTFIHAASLPPKVIESRLDEPYYATRYLGARRFLPDVPASPQSADLGRS
ncbi:MAG TPA: C40 family peptidase, partial [Deinococcales bacterium]|nr:C40 family peptidase [Deinococcales bacterium]